MLSGNMATLLLERTREIYGTDDVIINMVVKTKPTTIEKKESW
jgi:hypothetical protein